MRKTMLMLLFGGAIALAAAVPSKANAQWWHRYWMMNNWNNAYLMNFGVNPYLLGYNPYLYRAGPMGSYSIGGPTSITPFSFQGYNGFAYNFSTNYQFAVRRNYILSLLSNGGSRALGFNSNAGYLARITTPNLTGFMISPFVGYQTFNVPSSTFNIPLGNNISNFYLSYLLANFYSP